MWRSVLLGLVLAGLVAGCSLGGGSGADSSSEVLDSLSEGQVSGGGVGVTPMPDGIVTGRVFTTACGGPAGSPCPLRVYRGSLEFCSKKAVLGPCPSARVDGTGHYTITLRPGRHYLYAAAGSGNVVYVTPRLVVVHSGQTTTLNINGGNLMS